MEVPLKYGFEILITQGQRQSLSAEEESAMMMGVQQAAIQHVEPQERTLHENPKWTHNFL